MSNIIGIQVKEKEKIQYFDSDGKNLKIGQKIVVQTSRGLECGTIVMENYKIKEKNFIIRKIVRIASEKDILKSEENLKKSEKAEKVFKKKVREHGLRIRFVDAIYTLDCRKIVFYFTAEGRIDFRELVKDLANFLKVRIELRQIGFRDYAKLIGGLGGCGRVFCCASFLENFQPVSVKMAKDQKISLSPGKISGCCGKLMCCLSYEQENYS